MGSGQHGTGSGAFGTMGMKVPWFPGFGGESGVIGRSNEVMDLGNVGDGMRARVVMAVGRGAGSTSGDGSGGGVVGVVGGVTPVVVGWTGGD